MKASKYNFIFKTKNGVELAFNSITCSLAKIDDKVKTILKTINDIDYEKADVETKALIDSMRKGCFLIEDSTDELKLLEYMHTMGKFQDEILGLTIAPTLACNFKCIYCYENEKKGIMTKETQQAIFEFTKQHIEKKKSLRICWYGGEPLLAKEVIYDISPKLIELCSKNSVMYDASMTTNGYLLDDETCKILKNDCSINTIQVSLDGPPSINDARRKHHSGKSTFWRILEGVNSLSKNGINPYIRINIDKSNANRIEELLDLLCDNGFKTANIGFGHVTANTAACSTYSGNCHSLEEIRFIHENLHNIAEQKGFKLPQLYPGTRINRCVSDCVNAYVIDPDGDMYKCFEDIGNKIFSVGKVQDKILKKQKTMLFPSDAIEQKQIDFEAKCIQKTAFDHQKCRECILLPVCMGGCPLRARNNNGIPECHIWKDNLAEVLEKRYLKERKPVIPN